MSWSLFCFSIGSGLASAYALLGWGACQGTHVKCYRSCSLPVGCLLTAHLRDSLALQSRTQGQSLPASCKIAPENKETIQRSTRERLQVEQKRTARTGEKNTTEAISTPGKREAPKMGVLDLASDPDKLALLYVQQWLHEGGFKEGGATLPINARCSSRS